MGEGGSGLRVWGSESCMRSARPSASSFLQEVGQISYESRPSASCQPVLSAYPPSNLMSAMSKASPLNPESKNLNLLDSRSGGDNGLGFEVRRHSTDPSVPWAAH